MFAVRVEELVRAQRLPPAKSPYIFNHSGCRVAVTGDGHTPSIAKTRFGVRV